jgi:hypothetical protein
MHKISRKAVRWLFQIDRSKEAAFWFRARHRRSLPPLDTNAEIAMYFCHGGCDLPTRRQPKHRVRTIFAFSTCKDA